MRPRLRHVELRRIAATAERQCRRERAALHRTLERLHAHGERHAAGWLLGGGLAIGAIAARLPLIALLRAARFVVDAASFVRGLPIGPPGTERATNLPEHSA